MPIMEFHCVAADIVAAFLFFFFVFLFWFFFLLFFLVCEVEAIQFQFLNGFAEGLPCYQLI